MTLIDFSQIETPDTVKAKAVAAQKQAANAVCTARITEVLDAAAASNLQMAFVLDELTAEERTLCQAAHSWIAKMRETTRALARDPDAAVADESHWPAPPEGLRALAKRF